MEGHKPHLLEYFPAFINSSNSIIHYTCNSPPKKILDKYGINSKGNEFGCANEREVLEIPIEIYKEFGFSEINDKDILNLNLEKLIRDLK